MSAAKPRPGWALQPNFQFIRRPGHPASGGDATDPLSITPGKHLKDAAVLGLRTVIKF
jgi:porin